MKTKYIVANWKLNPTVLREAKALMVKTKLKAGRFKKINTIVCPSTAWLALWAGGKPSKNLFLGAQDAFWESDGAHTGEVSPAMLKDLGCQYVILGHSEKRAKGETDETVNQKVRAALKAGLTVILCVGEAARDDHGKYLEVIKEQLIAALAKIPKPMFARLVVAYEPVWAIGENAAGADTPEAFLTQKIYIQKVLSGLVSHKEAIRVPVLYGGSVNPKNAFDFLVAGQADGLLVGRSSWRADTFGEILALANNALAYGK